MKTSGFAIFSLSSGPRIGAIVSPLRKRGSEPSPCVEVTALVHVDEQAIAVTGEGEVTGAGERVGLLDEDREGVTL